MMAVYMKQVECAGTFISITEMWPWCYIAELWPQGRPVWMTCTQRSVLSYKVLSCLRKRRSLAFL
jgi:hypothetical protein